MNLSHAIKFCALAAAFCCFAGSGAYEAQAGHGNGKHHGGKDKHRGYERRYVPPPPPYVQHNGKPKPHSQIQWQEPPRQSYFHKHGRTRLGLPPNQYPPPGECRVWYPGKHQPALFGCGMVPPPGAWVLHRPRRNPGQVRVRVYDPQRPNAMLSIGEFDFRSGVFLRELDADND
jgi:hypothetical protein